MIVTEQKDVIALLVSENEGKLQFVAQEVIMFQKHEGCCPKGTAAY